MRSIRASARGHMPRILRITPYAVAREEAIQGLMRDDLLDGVYALIAGARVRTDWKTLDEAMAALGWALGEPTEQPAKAQETTRARRPRA